MARLHGRSAGGNEVVRLRLLAAERGGEIRGETDDDRAWTILLLLNVATGKAAVVPGYAAERCLEDADLRKILIAMKPLWSGGRTVDAVLRFFETCAAFLEQSWRVSGKPKGGK